MSAPLVRAIHDLAETIRHGDHAPEDRAALFDALEAMVDELVDRLPPAPPSLVLLTRTRHVRAGNGDRNKGQQ